MSQAEQIEGKSLIHLFGKCLSNASHVPGTMEALVPSGEQARFTNSKHSGPRGTLSTEPGTPVLRGSLLSGGAAHQQYSPLISSEQLEALLS